jgi:hypothetical protein
MKMLLSLLASLTLANTAFASPLQTITATDLVGTWILVDSLNPNSTGPDEPYCNGVHGKIIYTADGYVSVSLNCGPRLKASEPADISGRKFFYSGKFSLEGSQVTHHLDNASDVNLIGTDTVREASLDGPLLTLKGVNQGRTFTAVWRKVQPTDTNTEDHSCDLCP